MGFDLVQIGTMEGSNTLGEVYCTSPKGKVELEMFGEPMSPDREFAKRYRRVHGLNVVGRHPRQVLI